MSTLSGECIITFGPLVSNLYYLVIFPLQKSAVHALKKFNVEVKFDERNGKITLIGTSADMLEASGTMHELIRDAERNKQAGQEANLVSDMVQWYIIDINSKGNELIDYKKNVNLVIERAYRDAQPKATFCDADKNEYTVDFNTMKEFPTKNPQDTVDVIRRDLLKGNPLLVNLIHGNC